MEVRFSNNDDVFDDSERLVDHREPVFVTGNSVRTRNWLWRQTEAGRAATADTKNLLFLIDGFLNDKEDIIKARDELAAFLKTDFGADVLTGFVSSENPSYEIK
jgi:DNA/RNA-binding domain of Phe-tRNA-synthetase-like protein